MKTIFMMLLLSVPAQAANVKLNCGISREDYRGEFSAMMDDESGELTTDLAYTFEFPSDDDSGVVRGAYSPESVSFTKERGLSIRARDVADKGSVMVIDTAFHRPMQGYLGWGSVVIERRGQEQIFMNFPIMCSIFAD